METNSIITRVYEKCKSDGLTRVTSRNIEKIIGHKLDDSEKLQLKWAKQELNHVVENLLNHFLKRPLHEYRDAHGLDERFAYWNEGGLECVEGKLKKIGYSFEHVDLKKADYITIKKIT